MKNLKLQLADESRMGKPPGSARVSRAGSAPSPKQAFPVCANAIRIGDKGKFAIARRNHQHARRVRYPIRCLPASFESRTISA